MAEPTSGGASRRPPPVPTAPPEFILDEDDLAEMRDALRSGRTVTVASDGHVYVSTEPTGPPMPEAAETFVESKLGQVRAFLQQGGGMTIHPDGQMAGTFDRDTRGMVFGPDTGLSDDELNYIHKAVSLGALVGIQPDGSIYYVVPDDAHPPDAATTARIMADFRAKVDDGVVARALAEGTSVRLVDGEVDFPPKYPTDEPGIPFPEPEQPSVGLPGASSGIDPAHPERFDVETIDLADHAAMSNLSDALDARADAAREQMELRAEQEVSRLGIQRDREARAKYGAEQEAAAAQRQVDRESRAMREARDNADRLRQQADDAAARGESRLAEESREQARTYAGREVAARERAKAAAEEKAALELEATEHGRQVDRLEGRINDINDSAQSAERSLDAMEARARALDDAASHSSEAARLRAAADDLARQGDTEAATLTRNAADYEAKLAAAALAGADAAEIDPIAVDRALGVPESQLTGDSADATVGSEDGPASDAPGAAADDEGVVASEQVAGLDDVVGDGTTDDETDPVVLTNEDDPGELAGTAAVLGSDDYALMAAADGTDPEPDPLAADPVLEEAPSIGLAGDESGDLIAGIGPSDDDVGIFGDDGTAPV